MFLLNLMRIKLIVLLLLSVVPAYAGVQNYGANEHQSKWVVNASPVLCKLSHDIPLYGTARFSQKAGGELEFVLDLDRKPLKKATARLSSVAPAWRHAVLEKDLGETVFRQQREALRLPEAQARRLLVELADGMFPTFRYVDWLDGRDQVKVALSAVNIRSSLSEFANCLAGVLPYDFGYVRSSKLYFGANSATLSQRARMRLDELARYLAAGDLVSRINVTGYSDSRGYRSANKRMGMRRAEAVRDYLIARGVSSRLFKLASYGERRPAASNRSSKGRALNRRVTIELAK